MYYKFVFNYVYILTYYANMCIKYTPIIVICIIGAGAWIDRRIQQFSTIFYKMYGKSCGIPYTLIIISRKNHNIA